MRPRKRPNSKYELVMPDVSSSRCAAAAWLRWDEISTMDCSSMVRYRNDPMKIDTFSVYLSVPFYRFFTAITCSLGAVLWVMTMYEIQRKKIQALSKVCLFSHFVSWQQNNSRQSTLQLHRPVLKTSLWHIGVREGTGSFGAHRHATHSYHHTPWMSSMSVGRAVISPRHNWFK